MRKVLSITNKSMTYIAPKVTLSNSATFGAVMLHLWCNNQIPQAFDRNAPAVYIIRYKWFFQSILNYNIFKFFLPLPASPPGVEQLPLIAIKIAYLSLFIR